MNEKITRRALEASIKVDASSWPNTLPIKRYGFLLKKQPFWDSLYIKYNIPLKCIPSFCVFGAAFKFEHALL